MEKINLDEFKKAEMRVGEVLSAEPVEGSEKLLKLSVNFGPFADAQDKDEVRQVVSGIAKHVTPEQVVGKKFAFATNLEPRAIMGLESQAMLLAVGGDGETPFAILEAPNATPGARVR
jgi:methionine--tRNA ligase beta chain